MDSANGKALGKVPAATTLAATGGWVYQIAKRIEKEPKQSMTPSSLYYDVYRIIKSLRVGTGLVHCF